MRFVNLIEFQVIEPDASASPGTDIDREMVDGEMVDGEDLQKSLTGWALQLIGFHGLNSFR